MTYKYISNWRVKTIMWIARRLGFTTTNQTLKWAKSNEKYRKYNIYLEYYEKWQPKMKLVKEEF